jgi:peptidyl-prolyl cis-trans isomerase B (cyclophilin B)
MNRRTFVTRAAAVGLVTACGGGTVGSGATPTIGVATTKPTSTPGSTAASRATVELAKGGSFTFTLRSDKAPLTVARFVGKARSGFYNDLTFHRSEDWVVQGGDPTGSGTGGNLVPSEYNDLPFVAGAVGIARQPDPARMNDSQFFVLKADARHLDKVYANFGLVTAGMDVVRGIRVGDKIKAIRIE